MKTFSFNPCTWFINSRWYDDYAWKKAMDMAREYERVIGEWPW